MKQEQIEALATQAAAGTEFEQDMKLWGREPWGYITRLCNLVQAQAQQDADTLLKQAQAALLSSVQHTSDHLSQTNNALRAICTHQEDK